MKTCYLPWVTSGVTLQLARGQGSIRDRRVCPGVCTVQTWEMHISFHTNLATCHLAFSPFFGKCHLLKYLLAWLVSELVWSPEELQQEHPTPPASGGVFTHPKEQPVQFPQLSAGPENS